MATEHQIRAKSTGPVKEARTGPARHHALLQQRPVAPAGSSEHKRTSSRNAAKYAACHRLFAGTVVLKGESTRRFNGLAAALTLQFQPSNYVQTALAQTMVAARWRLLRMWGIRTTGFELEMARARQNADPAAPSSGAVLAAVAFRALADSSRVLALQLCLEAQRVRRTPSRASGTVLCRTPFCACSSEAASDRQYNDRQYNDREYSHALAMLLKLRATPDSNAPSDPPLNLTTETMDDDFQSEPNSEPHFQADPPIETLRYRRSPRRPPSSSEPNSHPCGEGLRPAIAANSNTPSDPPLNLTTETWDDDFQTEPNSEPHSQPDPPIETMRYRRSPRRPLTSREPNFHACEADLRPASSMSQPAKHGNWRASSEQGICGAGPRPAIAGWKPAPLGRLSRVEQELANVPPSQSETAPRQATVTNRNSKSSGSPLLCYPTNSCSPPVIITRIITATP